MSRSDYQNNIVHRIPRNSPVLWNVGHSKKVRYFHDGRVEEHPDFPSGFKTPANDDLPNGLENLLAAQALFPITSPEEMAGNGQENDISVQAQKKNWAGKDGVWKIIELRLQTYPKYVEAFKKAYPEEIRERADIKINHYANAISEFQSKAFKSLNSPYDRYVNGDSGALNEKQLRGLQVFNGKGKCSQCHTPPLFTDDKFYSLGFPQIGPGKGDGKSGKEDFGRMKVTALAKDQFKFITPVLRNIALSAPYGHAGSFETLDDVVKAHFMSDGGHSLVKTKDLRLPNFHKNENDYIVFGNRILRRKIIATRENHVPELTSDELDEVVAFLHSLTEEECLDMNRIIPKEVMSGIPIHN